MVDGADRQGAARRPVVAADVTVSVITVVRNGASHVGRALESVLSQDHPRVEYLVLDGGSTDGTVDIIRAHASRLAYWHSRQDAGIYDAMNQGVARATGELVGILNSDDWYEPGAVSAAAAAYAESRPDVVHGRVLFHDADGGRVGSALGRNLPLVRLFTTPFKHPAMLVARSAYDRIGLYDTRYPLAADYDFMLRAVRAGVRAVRLDRVLTHVSLVGVTTADPRISAPDELADILRRHTGSRAAARLVMATRRAHRRIAMRRSRRAA